MKFSETEFPPKSASYLGSGTVLADIKPSKICDADASTRAQFLKSLAVRT